MVAARPRIKPDWREVALDVLLAAGLAAITYGVTRLSISAGWIVGGLCVIAFALVALVEW